MLHYLLAIAVAAVLLVFALAYYNDSQASRIRAEADAQAALIVAEAEAYTRRTEASANARATMMLASVPLVIAALVGLVVVMVVGAG